MEMHYLLNLLKQFTIDNYPKPFSLCSSRDLGVQVVLEGKLIRGLSLGEHWT
jgi:hypothetical protein